MSSNKLYILHQTKSKNHIYAISEYENLIMYYISLFDEYFGDNINKSEYTISIVSKYSDYLKKYGDYHLFPIGEKNKFVLTEWEWNYYKPYFKELYERAKETIINLQMFGEIYSFHTSTDLSLPILGQSADVFYDIASSFDIFMENIPINFIKKHIMLEPIKAHKFNTELQMMENNYRIKLYKDN